MLDLEYKKLHDKSLRRSWPLTFLCTIVAIAIGVGIFSVIKYVGHDGYIVFTVVVPAAFCALLFAITALNGRKEAVKEAFNAVLSIMVWWP